MVIELAAAATLLLVVILFTINYFVFVGRRLRRIGELEEELALRDSRIMQLTAKFEERELLLTEIMRGINGSAAPRLKDVLSILGDLQASEGIMEHESLTARIGQLIELSGSLSEEMGWYAQGYDIGHITETGLVVLLEQQAERINALGGLKCYVDIHGDENLLSAEQQVVVYGIARECLRNTMMHANAYILEFDLTFGNPDFVMKVSDDGVGFEVNHVERMNTRGIMEMQQRAASINGSLGMVANNVIGTQVTLTVPI